MLKEIKVLDKGYVQFIDIMGDDYAILEAARISTGAEPKKGDEKDRGLIKYLYRNSHMSPFEMVQLKFRIKMPIFVMRQFVRHRTACLSADSVIWFDRYNKTIKLDKKHSITYGNIKHLYDQWHFGIFGNSNCLPNISHISQDNYYTKCQVGAWFYNRIDLAKKIIPFKIEKANNNKMEEMYKGEDIIFFLNYIIENEINHKRENIKKRKLRMFNEENKIIESASISDIIYSGKKEVFEIELKNGYKIKTSKDHLFYTSKGWLKLEDFMFIKSNSLSWDNNIELYSNGEPAYQNKETLKDLYWNKKMNIDSISKKLGCSYHTIRKWLRVHSLQDTEYKRFIGKPAWNKGKTYTPNFSKVKNPFKPLPKPVVLSAKPIKIKNIKFVGIKDTYDISVNGKYHNFIANGFVVHNSINESSARYREMELENYFPESIRIQSTNNNQGSSGEILSEDKEGEFYLQYDQALYNSEMFYENSIKNGVARELARIAMPVSQYTEIYYSVNLRNLFHFFELRLHPHAQMEIRVYAEAMLKILESIDELKWSVEMFKEDLKINYLIQNLKNKFKNDYDKLEKNLKKIEESI